MARGMPTRQARWGQASPWGVQAAGDHLGQQDVRSFHRQARVGRDCTWPKAIVEACPTVHPTTSSLPDVMQPTSSEHLLYDTHKMSHFPSSVIYKYGRVWAEDIFITKTNVWFLLNVCERHTPGGSIHSEFTMCTYCDISALEVSKAQVLLLEKSTTHSMAP